MRRAVWGLVVLLVASSVEARQAQADFRVCNAAPFRIEAAFGYRDAQRGWVSRGWWHVNPGVCSTLFNGPLRQRHFYLYANGTGDHSDIKYKGNTPFCIQVPRFTLYQSQYGSNKQEDCAASGLTSARFIDIDTQGKTDWSQRLTYSAPRPSGFKPQPAPDYVPSRPAPTPVPGGDGGGSACQRFPNLC